MQHPTNQALFAYWNAVRNGRIAPRRFDIEPSQLGTMLSETFILESDGTQSATFRLAGTRICDVFGREFRGTYFTNLFVDEKRAAIEANIDEMRAHGAVFVLSGAALPAERPVQFEILMLPLVHSETRISRILGVIAAIDPPHWLGSERLPLLDIQHTERIWPDGRPHAVAEKFRNQVPLMPELAGARIVRSNRRSFRILDGGLHKN